MLIYFIITSILVFFDQLTKYLVVKNFKLYETKNIIPKFLSFTYVRNTGAAWSILENKMWFFYIISVIVILFIFYYIFTEAQEDYLLGIILSIILAGTIGNFIDRLRLKYVVDMIQVDFIDFPIFNVADILLVIGIGLLSIYSIYIDYYK